MNLSALIEHFHFLRPLWLLAVPLIAILWLSIRKIRRRNENQPTIVAPHLAQALNIPGDSNRLFDPLAGLHAIAFCAALAMAGPSWHQQPSPLIEDEAILVVALDLSRTMLQSDIQPSRLERAKQKIQDLLTLRSGSRSGLIVYAGSAHSVIPVTNDLEIVRNFLSAVQVEMMPRTGKSATPILPLFESMIAGSDLARHGLSGTLLLISDGVDDKSIQSFGDYFQNQPHQLIVWGIGSQEYSSEDEQAIPVDYVAKDRDSLRALARAGNGHYLDITSDKRDIQRTNWRIDNHLLFVDDVERPWKDMGYFLLLPMLMLGLLWFRKGWTVQYGLAVVLIAFFYTSVSPPALAADPLPTAPYQRSWLQKIAGVWLSDDQLARYYFERGEYLSAARFFQDPMWRGIALYMAEEFTDSAAAFANVESKDGLFNLGNSLAHGQHYVKAVAAYTELLNRSPQHGPALNNREIIQALIDDINRMSESQQSEPGESSRELGDEPQRADGAEQPSQENTQVTQQFSADQILTDERIQAQWMKQVQQDPARFLSAKFQMQLQRSENDDDL